VGCRAAISVIILTAWWSWSTGPGSPSHDGAPLPSTAGPPCSGQGATRRCPDRPVVNTASAADTRTSLGGMWTPIRQHRKPMPVVIGAATRAVVEPRRCAPVSPKRHGIQSNNQQPKVKRRIRYTYLIILLSHLDTGIVGSNPAQGIDVCLCFCVVLSCVGIGLATGWSLVHVVLTNVTDS
jgi:hypothetical protein